MTRWQRLKSILFSLFLLLVASLPLWIKDQDVVYDLIVLVFGVSLLIRAIRNLIFFFTMGRFMIGAKSILLRGVIVFDFALFTLSVTRMPTPFITLYLSGIMIFAGVVDLMRARDSGKISGHWMIRAFQGVFGIVCGLLCLFNIRNTGTAVLFFSLHLFSTAMGSIITAMRPSAIVAIQ